MKAAAQRMATQVSKSFGMYEQAMALKIAQPDADIIHLEVGRPSADTPAHIDEVDEPSSTFHHRNPDFAIIYSGASKQRTPTKERCPTRIE